MKKNVINIMMAVCLLAAVGCGGYLAYYYYNSSKSEKAVAELKNMMELQSGDGKEAVSGEGAQKKPEMVSVDGILVQKKFQQLYSDNRDFMGWIQIPDTRIDYPVMYSPKDSEGGEFYIHKDYDGNYSAAGLPFIDKNCSVSPATDNVIIYGHNMKSGKMFRDLLKFGDRDFCKTHKTFRFDTIYEDGVYEVVAAFYGEILPEDSPAFKYYEFVNAGDQAEFIRFVDNIKRMSVVDTGVDVEYGDRLLTLSTCAYHVPDGRFAVVAKKVE